MKTRGTAVRLILFAIVVAAAVAYTKYKNPGDRAEDTALNEGQTQVEAGEENRVRDLPVTGGPDTDTAEEPVAEALPRVVLDPYILPPSAAPRDRARMGYAPESSAPAPASENAAPSDWGTLRTMSRPAMKRAVRPTSQPGAEAMESAPVEARANLGPPAEAMAVEAMSVEAMAVESAPPEAVEVAEDANAAPRAAGVTPEENFDLIDIFYATDRAVAQGDLRGTPIPIQQNIPLLVTFAVTCLCVGGAFLLQNSRRVLSMVALIALIATGYLGLPYVSSLVPTETMQAKEGPSYGNGRGSELQMGVCQVSLPKDHRVGEIERPQILKLELREDAEKHVTLRKVMPQEQRVFFDTLRERVSAAPKRDVFIFVHGYNVTFEDAAMRTAQMTYDLMFQGAPVFYSWPSQGGLFKYTVDENNVDWTVHHLKPFLLDVARESGAERINLIAHSMGNRAMTKALAEISRDLRGQPALFNEVILAAPDIDAAIFKRDIAPQIVGTAKRTTLYASSNDNALVASKKIHGFPRAGESGADLVVLDGIETIDVSTVETDLLGHSYYGDSDSIIADLIELIHLSKPANSRSRLTAQLQNNSLTYWMFDRTQRSVARERETGVR